LRTLEATTGIVHGLDRLDEYHAVIRDLLEYYRRMCVDNNLAQRILDTDRLLSVDGNIHQKLEYGWNPLRMNAILRFFQTENTLHLGIALQNGQCKKPQGPIRQCPCRMWSPIPVSHVQRQEFPLFIEIYVDAMHVVDEFSETVGDLTVCS